MLTEDDFVGQWVLSRHITDRMFGQDGRMQGVVNFREMAGGLVYAEDGTLTLHNGQALRAQRSYLWQFGEAGVDVRFDDGRAFHSFVPAGRGAGTDHPCGDDFYRVTYDFEKWPVWTAKWIVSGPKKDYTSVSTYQRG